MSNGNLAGIGHNYDPNLSENNFELLPEGDYAAMITNSEIKQSKAGNNMLSLEWSILQGPLKDRKVFEILNLFHPDQVVKNIAVTAFNSIQTATGVFNPSDSVQLHGKPVMIRVKVKGDFNQIKSHKPLQNQQQSQPVNNQVNQQSQPANNQVNQQQPDQPAFLRN